MAMHLTANFIRLLREFRQHDLVNFRDVHDKLYRAAKEKSNYRSVISHYYSVMAPLIDEYFSGNFHFVPPKEKDETFEMATQSLHQRIATLLCLSNHDRCLDIGCGIGSAMIDIARTGADVIGLTIAENEVKIGNEKFGNERIENCRIIECDCVQMPFDDASFASAYAIYALKYFVDLSPVLKEVSRVLRKGGRLAIYDLVKTEKFDELSTVHTSLLADLEYACGMPPLHSRDEMISGAEKNGLQFIKGIDLSKETEYPFHHCFSRSKLFMFLLRSRMISFLILMLQKCRILPRGFHGFYEIFLSGTIDRIVTSGDLHILSGSEILLFEKV